MRGANAQKILLTFLHDFFAVTLVHDLRDCIIIFFLTSFFNNSIHSTSCSKRPLHIFHEKWKGE